MMHWKSRTAPQGFSLVEVLISMAIMTIIGGSLLAIMLSQMQLTSTHNRNIINQEDVREVVVFMSEELSLTGTAAVEPFMSVADAHEICFIADLDGNDVPDQVRYTFADGQITRTLYATNDGGATYDEVSTDVILSNVADAEFEYFGPGNSTSPDIDIISSVQIKVSLDIDATSTAITSGKLADQQQMTRITLRNRLL
jgi:prepilin-type N-terminal cleavage/methylation domain-containing protein